MRKKLTLLHSLIVFASLLILVITSCFTVSTINKSNYEKELKNYLNITQEVLSLEEKSSSDTTIAIKNTVSTLSTKDTELRITIISKTGEVIQDSDKSEITTSHLDREEIKNLGTIVYRYSSTLSKKMMYLAEMDKTGTYYIRVSIPLGSINEMLRVTIIVSSITLIVVLCLSVIIDIFVIDKSLKPLKEDTRRLASIIHSDYIESNEDDDLESISYQIDKTKDLINEKIQFLTLEKEKLNFILNSMNQGLLILDDDKNIQLFNDKIPLIFKNNIKEKDKLTSLTIIPDIQEAYKSALSKQNSKFDIEINNRSYLVNVDYITENWISSNSNNIGVMMTFVDMTEKKNLENAKRDFFSNASHELKSPLTSIIGYTEMIKNGFLSSDEEIKDAEDRILSESNRMNEIVKEMLDLSRLESEDREKSIESLSVLESLRVNLGLYEKDINDKELTINLDETDFKVNMDKEDLNLLIKNLIENGIRYNKEKGTLTIKINPEKKSISITDTGIGIPKDDLNRIFERFYRVDKARSRKLGGTGLGLSIVKHICLNYQIRINVESILDVGSTFTLNF